MKEEKKKQAVSFFFFFKDSGPVCNDTIKRHTDTLTWGQKCSIIKKKRSTVGFYNGAKLRKQKNELFQLKV